MTKTPMTEAWKENVNYELIPGDENFWKVRIKEGDFIETVFSFGSVAFDDQSMMVKFDFTVDYSPISDLELEDPELRKTVSGILHSILVGLLDDNQP
jgi:hypothetical protein